MKSRSNIRNIIVALGVAAACSFARAQEGTASLDLADQLEQGIYLQEAQADLDAAIDIYQDILAEGELVDSIAAEAKYRLAICYLDQGDKSLAYYTLKSIEKEYPDQTQWVTQAKRVLPEDFDPEITPWYDGERTHYEWRSPSGVVLGKSFAVMRKIEREGRSLWRMESRYFLNGDRALILEFDSETFQTTFSEMKVPELGNMRATYGEDGKSVTVVYEKNGSTREYSHHEQIFDNEQGYGLMRQMSPEVGYSMTKNIFVPMSGVIIPIVFSVVERLEMDTALGTVDCYKVDLDLPATQQSLYFTADDRRILTKLTVGGVEAILVKLDTANPDEENVYANQAYGFSVSHPNDWVAVEMPPRGEGKEVRVEFGESNMEGGFSLYSDTNDKIAAPHLDTIETFVAHIQKEEAPRRTEEEFDETWRRRMTIGGMDAIAYKMKPRSEGSSEYNRYTYVVLSATRHYVFHAFLNDAFVEKQLPRFERLVKSLVEKRL